MLPMAATTRQTPVKPPMMYHHWPLEIRPGIQEKNSVPTRASIQETEPSATLRKSTGSGKKGHHVLARRPLLRQAHRRASARELQPLAVGIDPGLKKEGWWSPRRRTPNSISRPMLERGQASRQAEKPDVTHSSWTQDPLSPAPAEPQTAHEEAAALHQGARASETAPGGLALPALPGERLRSGGHQSHDA